VPWDVFRVANLDLQPSSRSQKARESVKVATTVLEFSCCVISVSVCVLCAIAGAIHLSRAMQLNLSLGKVSLWPTDDEGSPLPFVINYQKTT
jgi:hypothetical protein